MAVFGPSGTMVCSGAGCACGSCSQTFIVGCCMTVKVYDHSGGTLLASGSNSPSGNIALSWTGSSGTYWVVLNGLATGFTDYGQSLGLTCGSSTTLYPALTTGTTLSLTDSIAGSCTLTMSLGFYNGTVSYSYPGCQGCPAISVNSQYQLSPNLCTLSITYYPTSAVGPNLCPTTTHAFAASVTSLVPTSIVCSPFNMSWSLLAGQLGNMGDYFYCDNPFTVTITP